LSVSSNFLPRIGADIVVVLYVKVYSIGTQVAQMLVIQSQKHWVRKSHRLFIGFARIQKL